jgi:hypothetical protein
MHEIVWTREMDRVLIEHHWQSDYLIGRKLGLTHSVVKRRRRILSLGDYLRKRKTKSVASFLAPEPYRRPGWEPSQGPPCRGCEHYPPMPKLKDEPEESDVCGHTKATCRRCQSRLDWCVACGAFSA